VLRTIMTFVGPWPLTSKSNNWDKIRWEEAEEAEEEKIRLKQYVSLRSKGRHNYFLWWWPSWISSQHENILTKTIQGTFRPSLISNCSEKTILKKNSHPTWYLYYVQNSHSHDTCTLYKILSHMIPVLCTNFSVTWYLNKFQS
jgi:hypothetical protein